MLRLNIRTPDVVSYAWDILAEANHCAFCVCFNSLIVRSLYSSMIPTARKNDKKCVFCYREIWIVERQVRTISSAGWTVNG